MEPEPIEISVEETKRLLDAGEIMLIDCREENEYSTAKIEGAVLLPMSRWNEVTDQLAAYQSQRVVVHCHHGGRSLRVTRWMRENGFPATQNMTGGIQAWSERIDASVPQY